MPDPNTLPVPAPNDQVQQDQTDETVRIIQQAQPQEQAALIDPGSAPQPYSGFALPSGTSRYDFNPQNADVAGMSTMEFGDLMAAKNPVNFAGGLFQSFLREANHQLDRNPYAMIPADAIPMGVDTSAAPVTPLMDPNVAMQKYPVLMNGKNILKFDQPLSEREAQERASMLTNQIRAQEAQARASSGAKDFVAELASGGIMMFTDPTNLLMAVPGLGEGLIGLEGGLLARTAVRIGDLGMFNALDQTATNALQYPELKQSPAELAKSILTNTLIMAPFAIVHAETMRFFAGDPVAARVYTEASPDAHIAAFHTALAQHMEGQPINIAAIYKADLLNRLDNDFARNRELVAYLREGGGMERDPLPGEPGFGQPRTVARDMGGIEVSPGAPVLDERIRAPLPEAQRLGVHDDIEAAQRAAKRYQDQHGVAAEPVETADGKYVLARRIDADLVRSPTNEAITFKNERAANRYIDQIIRPKEEIKGGSDAELAPKPNRYDVVPVGKVGEREYAILKNADDRTVTNWKKYPETVSHEKSSVDPYNPNVRPKADSIIPEHLRDEKNRVLDFADRAPAPTLEEDMATVAESRVKFERDLPGIVADMMQAKQVPEAVRAYRESLAGVRVKAEARRFADQSPTDGREIHAMRRDADALRDQYENIGKAGETDDAVAASIKEDLKVATQLKREADAMDIVAACMR